VVETLLSLCIGVGLSAACGFRVFVPLLVMSVAARGGFLSLGSGFEWIASSPAFIAFAVATVLEIGAYYVPWLDNFLDSLATPAAVIAGVVATAAAISGLSPFLTWSLAIIAGGGVAGLVQALTGVARGASTATTAGLGNPLLSTLEVVSAVGLSTVAIALPLLALVLLLLLAALVVVWRRARRRRREAT
jgi:hypothetical protein